MFPRVLSRLSLSNLTNFPRCVSTSTPKLYATSRPEPGTSVTPPLTIEDVKVTPRAIQRLKQILTTGEKLRVEVDGGGCSGFEYKIRLDTKLGDDDRVLQMEGVEVVVDKLSLGYLRGATVDYYEDLMKTSFRIVDNPVAEKGCSCGSSFALKLD
ncbi:unnamed protein product, partial [Mesorhabditis belari]|uniref:FeS cluster biogenesis domain-containing protein n=1 Tax=Mesorhabditis belari TaxID=2138241 RepID=A0AAF3FID0_9BILA